MKSGISFRQGYRVATNSAVLLILVFVGMISGCITPGPVSLPDEFLISEDEQQLWQESLAQQKDIENSGRIYRHAVLDDYLQKVVQKLQLPAFSDRLSIKIIVLNDPYMDAYAFPNGVVYVNIGALARLDNEAQLAALLAHEIVHCARRHALYYLRHYNNSPAFLAVPIAAISGRCRELELEADTEGLALMANAEYDPKEALSIFRHLKEELTQGRLSKSEIFKSHPNIREREANINHLLENRFQYIMDGVRNTDEFINQMHQVILDNAWLDLRYGRFESALAGAEKFLQHFPDSSRVQFLLGEIFRQRGDKNDTGKALHHYEKSIALDPTDSDPHKAIGLIRLKLGQRMLARKHFETCLVLAPKSTDIAYLNSYIQQCTNNREGS